MERYDPPEATHFRRSRGSTRHIDVRDVSSFLDPEPSESKTAYSISPRGRGPPSSAKTARDANGRYLDDNAERIRAVRAEEKIVATIEYAYATGKARGRSEGHKEERTAIRRAQDAELAPRYYPRQRPPHPRRPYYGPYNDPFWNGYNSRQSDNRSDVRIIEARDVPGFVEPPVVRPRRSSLEMDYAYDNPNPFTPRPVRRNTMNYEPYVGEGDWDDAYQSSKRQQRDAEWEARAHIKRGDTFAEDEAVRRREADDEGIRVARQRAAIRDLRTEADVMEAELYGPRLGSRVAPRPRIIQQRPPTYY